MASGPITSWEIDGETVTDFNLWGSKITADCDCSHEIKSCLLLGRKVVTNLDSILKSRDVTLPTNVSLVKAMVFSSNHAWIWELDYKESWVLKNWCFWIVGLRVPWTAKRSNQFIFKGNKSWIFIGRTNVEAETPIFWPPDGKNWLIGKDNDARNDWRWEEKGTTEDEMIGWLHHQLNGHEFE